jgi:hypothetical protein
MTDWTAVYDTYLAAASTADAEERARLLATCAVEDFEIISPFPYEVRGREAAAQQLGEVAAAMPGGGLSLVRTSAVDEHHGSFRATYANQDASGAVLSTGLHVVRTRDGLMAQLLVFVPADLPPRQ